MKNKISVKKVRKNMICRYNWCSIFMVLKVDNSAIWFTGRHPDKKRLGKNELEVIRWQARIIIQVTFDKNGYGTTTTNKIIRI